MVIFSYLPSKHLLRVLLYSRPWGRERNIKTLACLQRTQREEGNMVQRDHFSVTFFPFPQWICPGRGSGNMHSSWSTQLLPAAEGKRPHSVSHGVPKLCSQNIPEFAPGLLVTASCSLSLTDPFVSLHSDLGLPEVKEDRAKKKSPRLRGRKLRLTCLERQRASSIYIQNSP